MSGPGDADEPKSDRAPCKGSGTGSERGESGLRLLATTTKGKSVAITKPRSK